MWAGWVGPPPPGHPPFAMQCGKSKQCTEIHSMTYACVTGVYASSVSVARGPGHPPPPGVRRQWPAAEMYQKRGGGAGYRLIAVSKANV